MPIFQNGKAPVAMRYIDPAGVEHHVVAAYLGDRLVWDGTVPASVTAPRMHGGGGVPLPAVCAAATLDAPILSGNSEMLVPLPGGGGGVSVPLFAGTADVLEPLIGGSATVAPGAMEGHGEIHEPGIGTEVPGVAIVPTATGTGSILVPAVHVPADIEAPTMNGAAEVGVPRMAAGAAVRVPASTGHGSVLAPAITAAAVAQVPGMDGAGAMPTPTHAAGRSLEVPAMTGIGEMLTPVVEALNFPPSGMDKSGNFPLPANAWTTIPSWAIRSGFPDTVIVSNGIEVPAGVEVTISGQARFGANDSFGGNNMGIRVMADGVMIGTAAGTPGNSNTATLVPFTWKNETAGPVLITVEGFSSTTSFSRNVVQGGVNTYLTLVPVVQLIERAADNFNDGPGGSTGPLSANWFTTGGGTLDRVNGRLNGVGTPSVPLSYAWWHEPMPSDTQVVRAVVRWDGYDPEHSACGLVVRANPFQDPVTNPGTQFGVQFSWTRSIMALYYEDYDAPNGFVPVTGTAQYVNTSKFPEGAIVELRAEGNLYTARVNGTIMLQGTVENNAIPFSNRYVGLTIQDDSQVAGGGGPPGRLDDFQALTP